MGGRRVVVLWSGVGLAVAGTAGALVAWVGLDRANALLGVPAAVAALVGLGVAVHGLVAGERENLEASDSGRVVRQRGSATGRSRLIQVGGDSVQGSTATQQGRSRQATRADQVACVRRGAHVEQVAGDHVVPQGREGEE